MLLIQVKEILHKDYSYCQYNKELQNEKVALDMAHIPPHVYNTHSCSDRRLFGNNRRLLNGIYLLSLDSIATSTSVIK